MLSGAPVLMNGVGQPLFALACHEASIGVLSELSRNPKADCEWLFCFVCAMYGSYSLMQVS